MRGVALPLLTTKIDPAVGDDRFIDGAEFGPVCPLLDNLPP